jgi:phosphoenolpyruvate carboxykinase (ATP)
MQWSDKTAYKEMLLKLAGLFNKNFENFTDCKLANNGLTKEILEAGPQY